MTTELGHFALCLAFVIALGQTVLPLAGPRIGRAHWMDWAVPAAQAQFLLIAFSFVALADAYLASDFSVQNVAVNSHSAKPWIYKLSGTWGNHEGSMLLWVLILALFGAVAATVRGGLDREFRAHVLGVHGLIGVCFLAFVLFTSNPFTRLDPAPLEGNGLNPLLQDPGLAFHPPMLYIGYVGFSMAFSFAVAALILGRVDEAWARWVRPWTLAAWIALTAGIMLGSWWAYYELGWGGWWFWDPVENASLMPWLLGTALLHSAAVVEKRGSLRHWTILLAILTFTFSLLGTFLVRSGVLTSVHAFANDPERGVFILLILLGLSGGALALYAWRSKSLSGGGAFAPVSREGALVFNNLILVTACFTILIGTLYPLLLDALGAGTISVGPPYFNQTVVPLMLPLFVALPLGALMAWKRGSIRTVMPRLYVPLACAGIVSVVMLLYTGGSAFLACLGLGLAAWLTVGGMAEIAHRAGIFRDSPSVSWRKLTGIPRAVWGMAIAHSGLGIFVAGAIGVSVFQSEVIRPLSAGQTAPVGGYEIRFDGVRSVDGPNYRATQGAFTVLRNGREVTELFPERRMYPASGQPTTEVGIHTTGLADLYVVLGERQPEQFERDGGPVWAVRIYHKPLVPWLWASTLIMVLGGIVALSARQRGRVRVAGDRPAADQEQASVPVSARPAGEGAS